MAELLLGSFNLYNLVLPNVTYYETKVYDEATFQKKIEWIGRRLKTMNADVVGFQEVFHGEALKQALQASGLYGDEPAPIVQGETGQGPVVGLVSRLPVIDSTSIADFPEDAKLEVGDGPVPITSFSRPVLKVRLRLTPDTALTVFVAHLKSKRPDLRPGADEDDFVERAIGEARSLIRRAAESIAFRTLLVEELENTDHAVVAIGDLNDGPEAVTTQIVTGSPPWFRLPFDQKRKIWDVLLYNVKDIQARQSTRDVYFTHIYNGHYESLDHILVSEELYRPNPHHLGFVRYARVFNDHLVDETQSISDRVAPWQSDHGQVVARIQMRN